MIVRTVVEPDFDFAAFDFFNGFRDTQGWLLGTIVGDQFPLPAEERRAFASAIKKLHAHHCQYQASDA